MIVGLKTILCTQFVGTFTRYLHTRFHIPRHSDYILNTIAACYFFPELYIKETALYGRLVSITIEGDDGKASNENNHKLM